MGIIIQNRKLKFNDVWLEKYRPENIDEVVLDENSKKKFKEFIKNDEFPSLLFIGSPGTGKTTMAYILLDACIHDEMDFLEMNGSLFRGIDVIRNLDDFIKSETMFSKKKVIFIDEADKLTPDAQDSLRNLIEQNSDHLSFLLTANYAHKITDALKSRLQTYKFDKLPKENRRNFVFDVLQKEGISYNPNDVDYIIQATDPDLRRCLNEINKVVYSNQTGKILTLGNADEEFLIEQKFVDNCLQLINLKKNHQDMEMSQTAKWGYQQIMADNMDYYEVYEKLIGVLGIIKLKTMAAHYYNALSTCVSPKILTIEFYGEFITYIRNLYK